MLAAPFFRGTFSCLIIPTGFAHPGYSKLLPALRASAGRIRKYIENGGRLLVFGAALEKPDAYDWLPFPVRYSHDYQARSIKCRTSGNSSALISDFDAGCIECDGFFSGHNNPPAGTADDRAVILEENVGDGLVIVTSIHEYPSRSFLANFCKTGTQTLF
jgi:glutamine amidotransferase-like uncharacterized protein